LFFLDTPQKRLENSRTRGDVKLERKAAPRDDGTGGDGGKTRAHLGEMKTRRKKRRRGPFRQNRKGKTGGEKKCGL